MDEPWREVGDRVFVRRHASLDLNVGLVVGDGGCLVVDTRCSATEGRDLAAAVRRVTAEPWAVATTHAHFDHCFGTSAFLPAPVYAQAGCAAAIAARGAADRLRMARLYEQDGQLAVSEQILDSPLIVPDRIVERSTAVDVGGRRVEMLHLGRGHTDHDLVLVVPDAGVVLAGDLVEQGAPPQFRDGFPLDWPATLDALLTATASAVATATAPTTATTPTTTATASTTTTAARATTVVVPGHGDVVDPAFVAAQRDVLAELVRRSVEGRAEGAAAHQVAAGLPELGDFAVEAVERTYWQLDQQT